MGFEHEFLEVFRAIERDLRDIKRSLAPQRYSISITQLGDNMAIGNINAGSTGQFGATLLDNGAPYVAPSGSTYVFTPTFSASDTTVTFAPATTDASAGAIPLADQTVMSVPANDTGTSVTVGVSAVAPDGTTVTATLVVTLTPGTTTATFSVALSQLA